MYIEKRDEKRAIILGELERFLQIVLAGNQGGGMGTLIGADGRVDFEQEETEATEEEDVG